MLKSYPCSKLGGKYLEGEGERLEQKVLIYIYKICDGKICVGIYKICDES